MEVRPPETVLITAETTLLCSLVVFVLLRITGKVVPLPSFWNWMVRVAVVAWLSLSRAERPFSFRLVN
jgi:hypothetical protein